MRSEDQSALTVEGLRGESQRRGSRRALASSRAFLFTAVSFTLLFGMCSESAFAKSSAGEGAKFREAHQSLAKDKIKPRLVTQMIKSAVVNVRRDEYGNYLSDMTVARAKISLGGKVAFLADTPPYRDLRLAKFHDFAARGLMKSWIFFNNGPGDSAFLTNSSPAPKASYEVHLQRIARRTIAAISGFPEAFGKPKEVRSNRTKTKLIFSRVLEGPKRSVRSVAIGRRGEVLKIVRFQPRSN